MRFGMLQHAYLALNIRKSEDAQQGLAVRHWIFQHRPRWLGGLPSGAGRRRRRTGNLAMEALTDYVTLFHATF